MRRERLSAFIGSDRPELRAPAKREEREKRNPRHSSTMPTLTMSSTLLTFRCRADSGNLRYASLPQHSSRVGRINSACYTYTCYTYTDDHVGIRAQYRGIDLVMQVSVKSAINHRNRERERINCLGGRGGGAIKWRVRSAR